ncbi:YihY/virulence factor BrkB family protein [Kordiimonas sp. SCSIO 12610]|uniref:YihY/virulence factor BrkB family protein n=1 Tax=Kordiimonas sp. SCSIO 12610 TaxID=2829597 RepID=UPI002108B8EF|nr:YihY/virulence factor BrkB family protein [Kordiimonas sp. SCSIO 12610]UTW56758.1 YihY/virulence factor BrkB family protein [Kordiimonas sp. SCSIO 12610]
MNSLRKHYKVIKYAISKYFDNGGMAAAGNMAFLAMLSMFPFIIFLVAISGFLGQTERGLEAINFMFEVLPPEVSSVIRGPVQGIIKNTGAEILTGSILFAIWGAANGVEAARGVIVKAFGREHAPAIWLRRLESLAVVIFGAVTVILAMSILVLGPAIFKATTSLFPDIVNDGIDTLWSYLSIFVSPSILLLGLFGVYFVLTPRKIKKPKRIPGTILSLIFLLSTAKGLSVYLKYADNYDVTYGSLAGVVIMQLFCFIVSIGFVMGAELNAAYTYYRDKFEQGAIKSEQDLTEDDIKPDA